MSILIFMLQYIWRKREKILCVHGECAKRIYAYMENVRKKSMRTWRMREKHLCVHGESTKRNYAYMEKMQTESTICVYRGNASLITNLIIFNFLYLNTKNSAGNE
jgi:hypothetical protein